MVNVPTLDELKVIIKKQITKNLLQDRTCKNCIHGPKTLASCKSMKDVRFDTCCQWQSAKAGVKVKSTSDWEWDDGSKSKWRWYS
jgi:hypothetical protein